jgi:hypothetical protein
MIFIQAIIATNKNSAIYSSWLSFLSRTQQYFSVRALSKNAKKYRLNHPIFPPLYSLCICASDHLIIRPPRSVHGTDISPMCTWDAKITALLAMAGGTAPLVEDYLRRTPQRQFTANVADAKIPDSAERDEHASASSSVLSYGRDADHTASGTAELPVVSSLSSSSSSSPPTMWDRFEAVVRAEHERAFPTLRHVWADGEGNN